MPEPDRASDALPPELLDDYLGLIPQYANIALPSTAVRTGSLAARALLARAGLGDRGTLADLLRAARAGDHSWLARMHGVAPVPLCALAQTLALQEALPEDRGDALALYELIRHGLGAGAATPGHAALHALLALKWEGRDKARALLGAYRQIADAARREIQLDLDNPFDAPAGRPVQPWFAAFRALLPEPRPGLRDAGVDPERPYERDCVPFDRIESPVPLVRIEAPHRISVVVTAYQPDQGLLTAVRSIVAQTWGNVEVIIVDDGSGPDHDDMLRRAAALGPRIRVLRLPVNGGTYAARNAGLDAAGGEFVTFQDSDDWSHPCRLERQVQPLLAEPRLVATTSDGITVSDELLVGRVGVRSGRFNPSSLMFRRTAVTGRVGYFDTVRKAGDSEYIGRIQAVFGNGSVRHLGDDALALIRLSVNSLSRAEIRAYWMHPARVAYSSAYLCWHADVAAGRAVAYRPRDGADRPFSVPPYLRDPRGVAARTRRFDVVMAADWRFLREPQEAAVAELRALAAAGLRVAVLGLETYRTVLRRRVPFVEPVQRLINAGVIEQVDLYEPVEAALVLVREAAALPFAPAEQSRVRAGQVLIVADRAPARGDGTDRRYPVGQAAAVARRLFGADPVWCPADPPIRAALLATEPALECTPADLPVIMEGLPWAAPRRPCGPSVVGTDLGGAGENADGVAGALAVYDDLGFADVRLRLPDSRHPCLPVIDRPAWLRFDARDLDVRTFCHQLDFYLHFPHPDAVETGSRAALTAAATGCVVVAPERFAPAFGDAAVYAGPGDVADLIRRYRAEPALLAEQGRRARTVAARAYPASRYVETIAAYARTPQVPAQARREPAAVTGG